MRKMAEFCSILDMAMSYLVRKSLGPPGDYRGLRNASGYPRSRDLGLPEQSPKSRLIAPGRVRTADPSAFECQVTQFAAEVDRSRGRNGQIP